MSNSQKKLHGQSTVMTAKGISNYSHTTVTSVFPGRIHNTINWENTFAGCGGCCYTQPLSCQRSYIKIYMLIFFRP